MFDPLSSAGRFRIQSGEKTLNVNYCLAHFENFLDCIRSRRKPNADIEIGQRSHDGHASGMHRLSDE